MRDKDISGPVGDRVRDEIDRLGITKRGLARRVEMSPQSLYRKLAGETAFTLPELYRIAEALRVPTSTFLPEDLDVVA